MSNFGFRIHVKSRIDVKILDFMDAVLEAVKDSSHKAKDRTFQK